MNTNILIDKFIEKDISPEEEDILFENLYKDRTLRQELHGSIMLERGIGRRMAALAPAASETAGIFGSLGIAPATGASFIAGHAAASYGMNSIAASLSTMILAAFAFFGLSNIYGEDERNIFTGRQSGDQTPIISNNDISYPVVEKDLMIEPETINISERIDEKNNPDSDNTNITLLNTSGTEYIARKSKKNYDSKVPIEDNKQDNTQLRLQRFLNKRKIGYSESDYKENILSESVTFPLGTIKPFRENPTLTEVRELDSHEGQTPGANLLEIRQFSGLGTLPDDFNAAQTPILSNLGISYLMPVWDNLYLGISYDRKVYYLEYEATTDDGLFTFRQNTLYSSIMGTAQWLPLGAGGKINWFIRGSAGATVLGPTGSAMTGFYLPITDDINAMASYEFQTIGYSLDNNGFGWAYDQGLQIGFSVNLY
jgi:hypothetical protein